MTRELLQPEFSRPIPLDRIEKQHKTYKLEAAPEECAALAKRFGLLGIDYLKAECKVWRGQGALFCVEGHIESKLTQECVVTFVPVTAEIHEDFSEKFVAQGQKVDEDEEDVEELQSEELDLGEVVAQYFALSLNPYPRAQIVE